MNYFKNTKHPIQPLEKDDDGVVRFKKNAIVRFLLDAGPFDLNQIAMMKSICIDDRVQFAQLIGYSHSGAADLSYFDDETWEAAEFMFNSGLSEDKARIQYLEERIEELKESLKIPVKMCAEMFGIHESDIWDLMRRPGEEG